VIDIVTNRFADEPVPLEEPEPEAPRLNLPPPASASDLLFGGDDDQAA